jgi:hypothetical protein
MTSSGIVDLSGIPFIDVATIPNRFLASLAFYDGDWRVWLSLGDGKYVETKAWPSEAAYYGAEPELEADIGFAFLTFLAQHANFADNMRLFASLEDDVFNLAASLSKLRLIAASESVKNGASRMAATEVEYLLLVCRSMFDLMQELAAKLWDTVALTVPTREKRALRKTFSAMALENNRPRTAAEIEMRFGLPAPWAAWYPNQVAVFAKIRAFRDNLVHGGSRMDLLFHTPEGFYIRPRLGPFLDLDIWRDDERIPNALGPLEPVLAMIVHATLAACNEFAVAMSTTIVCPPPTVPGMRLFLRAISTRRWWRPWSTPTSASRAADRWSRRKHGQAAPVGGGLDHRPHHGVERGGLSAGHSDVEVGALVDRRQVDVSRQGGQVGVRRLGAEPAGLPLAVKGKVPGDHSRRTLLQPDTPLQRVAFETQGLGRDAQAHPEEAQLIEVTEGVIGADIVLIQAFGV